MVRSTPPSDWVVYVVVLGVVAAMLVGKYLMFFDSKESTEEIIEEESEDIVEDVIDEIVHDVEEKINDKL